MRLSACFGPSRGHRNSKVLMMRCRAGSYLRKEGFMRFWLLMGSLLVVSNASGQAPSSKLWTELKAKREMLPAVHQEFEVAQTLVVGSTNRSTHHQMVLDMSQDKWREREIGGARDRIRIFDGQDLFVMEQDQDEYVRTKGKANKEEPAPGPYGLDLEWSKATEVERRPCGFAKEDHVCEIGRA